MLHEFVCRTLEDALLSKMCLVTPGCMCQRHRVSKVKHPIWNALLAGEPVAGQPMLAHLSGCCPTTFATTTAYCCSLCMHAHLSGQ